MAAVWGIDIGKGALKAVKLRKTKEGMELLALEHIAYEQGDEEDERSEGVNAALKSFLVKHKIGGDMVVVGLPGLHAFSRFIKMPPVDKGKLSQMVRLEAQQQIPFPITEVNWDWVKIERAYEPGEEVEVGIFATRSELVDGFLRDLRDVKLQPDIVTIAPLAVYNFIRYNSALEEGATIILDVGAEHTDLVVVDGERFWIRNLRSAGNDVTKALAERFKVPFAEAEKLKRSASKSDQSKKIFTVMEQTLKDLVTEVHRSVSFFKNQAPDLDVKRMVLVGDGAKLKNITKYLGEQLGYDVTRVQELSEEKFPFGPDVDTETVKNHLLGFAVSLGLALQGVGSARCSINLAPQDLQVNSQLKKKLPLAAAAAVCAWAALGISYTYWKSNADKLAKTAQEASGVKQYEAQQQTAMGLRDVKPLEAQAQSLVGLGEGRTLTVQLLQAIDEVLAASPAKGNALIPDIYSGNPNLDQQDFRAQVAAVDEELSKKKINEQKLWLLSFKIIETKTAPVLVENVVTEAARTYYKVEIEAAKAVPPDLQNAADVSRLRDEIKRDLAVPLQNRLAGAPFFLRDGEQNPPAYGTMFVGIYKKLQQLHRSAEADPPGGAKPFQVVMVPLRFEIGLPPPKPVEAPKEASNEEGK